MVFLIVILHIGMETSFLINDGWGVEYWILLFFSSEIMNMFFILPSNFAVKCFWGVVHLWSSLIFLYKPLGINWKPQVDMIFVRCHFYIIFEVLGGFASTFAHRSPLLQLFEFQVIYHCILRFIYMFELDEYPLNFRIFLVIWNHTFFNL